MNRQGKGAYAERKVAQEARRDGWIVKGTGDAHGVVDQIHVRLGQVRLVQVKGNRNGGPYSNFGPEARAQMKDEALRAGFEAWLAWAPPDRKPTRWLSSKQWP